MMMMMKKKKCLFIWGCGMQEFADEGVQSGQRLVCNTPLVLDRSWPSFAIPGSDMGARRMRCLAVFGIEMRFSAPSFSSHSMLIRCTMSGTDLESSGTRHTKLVAVQYEMDKYPFCI
eukprot:2365210-Rhodomonas_salina.1